MLWCGTKGAKFVGLEVEADAQSQKVCIALHILVQCIKNSGVLILFILDGMLAKAVEVDAGTDMLAKVAA